ncbi:hybrid sensor histidine kinase/response regulator [Salinigranum rubrum]|uniref:histidine kinase n=1 Tax=Salinigranum rubrum TaxID=755307 RepID=A0A2I8VG70_9EURY|nr:PAS domain S-box protein [Salinigranum rubrum]AUV80910.1 hybrid sensor histidine kinase/response regulator [Salinigranum rubrum]
MVETVEEAVSLPREGDCDCVVATAGPAREFLDRVDGDPACPLVVVTAGSTAPLTDHARVRHHRADDLATLESRVVDAVLADRQRQQSADGERTTDEELIEREAAYRTLVENVPNGGVALFDRDLRYTRVGGEVFEQIGLDPDDVAGESLEEVHSPSFLDAHGDAYRQAFDGERSTVEFAYEDRRFRLDVVPVTEGDEVVAGLAMARDVTDEAERRRDLFVRSRAMDAAAIGLCLTDPTEPGNPLVYVNEGYERMTGYEAREVLGKNPRHLQGPETEAEARRKMREAVANAESVAVDITNYRKDGTPFVNHVEITPIFDDEGDLVHFLGSQVDVTDQHEHQRALARQNERLAEFTAIVSHDLRNPLAVARGRVELARRTGDLSHLDHAEASLERASELIDEMLDLAREGRTLDFDRVERVSVGNVARAAWDTVDTAGATLAVEAEWEVDADESRLRQLFENLFRNSVEHGSTNSRPETDDSVEHGSSDTETPVEVRVGRLDAGCGFFVEDDGPGVPDDIRDTVFDVGVTTVDGGTGFGLAIVRNVAEAHGWDVGLTEGEQGGARFEFVLPCPDDD